MAHLIRIALGCLIFTSAFSCVNRFSSAQEQPPQPTAAVVESVSLFASEPDIVTPTGIAVDSKGRVFCIESHTHFRPKDYTGPPTDRIRMYEDLDDDGKSDRVTNFFEGTEATMNLAFASDGSLYVATRAKILRLRDLDDDGHADQQSLIVDLRTKGNYPHNGLSGLAFRGYNVWNQGKLQKRHELFFGFGENLGADYTLVGSDKTQISGGGEGGNIFVCGLDGQNLRRYATGFWNPFGLTFDRTGNLFAIDNDPDWRPPCRLLHIVDGGDYGYRFNLGRRGTHPFTAWFGELPGTLGMVSGTGEAPSGILRCDELGSDGQTVLLSTSWGLHSIEQFNLKAAGATFVSEPKTIVKGGKDFRPVGIAQGPDGSLYVSDWCKRSYELHGFGRIWKIKLRARTDQKQRDLWPTSKHYPYESTDHLVRESAAHRLPDSTVDFPKAIQAAITPLEKATLIRRTRSLNPKLLLSFMRDADPFVRQAARQALAASIDADQLARLPLPNDPQHRLGVALTLRTLSQSSAVQARLPELLDDPDPDVRFVGIRWAGEENLEEHAEQLERDLRQRSNSGRLFESYLAALDLINKGRTGAEFEKAEVAILEQLLKSAETTDDVIVRSLRRWRTAILRDKSRPEVSKLKLDFLTRLLNSRPVAVGREVIATLQKIDSSNSRSLLFSIAAGSDYDPSLVAEAMVQLGPSGDGRKILISDFLNRDSPPLRRQIALSKLRQTKWSRDETNRLKKNKAAEKLFKDLESEVVSKFNAAELPKLIKSRLKSADVEHGRYVFLDEYVSQCSKCHRVDGRGGQIGPDLSNLSQMSVDRLLESIIDPSKEVAPRHTAWMIETYDGKSLTGVQVSERGDVQTYADTNGELFQVRFDEIERKKAVARSIMPEKLLDRMYLSDVVDLIGYLKTQRD